MTHRLCFFMVAALFAAAPHLVQGAVVIDDHFDDGDIGANANGTGTGFNAFYEPGYYAEGVVPISTSGTLQALKPEGASMIGIASKETFDFFNATGATIVWDVHHYVALQPAELNSFRTFVGVGDGPDNLDTTQASPFKTGEAYVWVQLSTNDTFLGAGTQGALLVDKPGGRGADVLATWDWADFDGLSPMHVTMNLDQDGYDLSFTDGTPNVTGSWDGYFSAMDWAYDARAIAMAQSSTGGRVVLDRVQVITNEAAGAAIPEPASGLLLTAAMLGGGLWGRRARAGLVVAVAGDHRA